MKEVGKSTKRVDAPAKVTGKAKYPGDFHFADELQMKRCIVVVSMPGSWKLIQVRLRLWMALWL